MGENIKELLSYIVSLSGGHRTLVERLAGGISTVAVGKVNNIFIHLTVISSM